MMLPILTIILTNLGILFIVTKSSLARGTGLPGKNAILTVSCVAWVFVFSTTPTMIRVMLQSRQVPVPLWLYLFGHQMLFMNAISNPVIYTVTNRGFREFMARILTKGLGSGGKILPGPSSEEIRRKTTATSVQMNSVVVNRSSVVVGAGDNYITDIQEERGSTDA